jgi:asparagine synthase (glutamine-hydrolysing)
MCGINGIVEFQRDPLQRNDARLHDAINRMNRAVAHRGPDDAGVFVHEGVGLGHRRLSIIDLSANGAQPMCSDDGALALVFNGEIYNYLELRSELVRRGHVFRSQSDSEVILHAYQEYGIECVRAFNGMWAFALYDSGRKTLFASRDRFGVKPFYYLSRPDRLIFSSEIKGILAVNQIREANRCKIYDYLAYGYRTNNAETFFASVLELPPAHNLVIRDGQVAIQRYWTLPDRMPPKSGASAREELLELLADAIKLRFRSDVPVAMLLSGGLDSTSIVRLADDMIESGALGATRLKAYTASFPGHDEDEAHLVRQFAGTCRHLDLVVITPDAENLVSRIEPFVHGLGEPIFSTTAFAHYMLMGEIRKHGTKVVLNGQGSDEAFAGYGRYIIGYFLLDTLLSRPTALPEQIRLIHAVMGFGYGFILVQFAKALLGRRFASYLRGRFQEGIVGVLAPDFRRAHYRYLDDSLPSATADNLDRHLRNQLLKYGFNQILHYEDHSAMQHSIEIRSPFIDYRLMEFAFSLRDCDKFESGVTKRVLREAFATRLPSAVVQNHRKLGFATPFNAWLREPGMKSFVGDILASNSFNTRAIWNPAKIRARFRGSEQYHSFPYWRVLNLELWARAYSIDNL